MFLSMCEMRNIYLVSTLQSLKHETNNIKCDTYSAHIVHRPCMRDQCTKSTQFQMHCKENQKKIVNDEKRKRFESQNPFNSGESVSYLNGMHQHSAFCVILLFRRNDCLNHFIYGYFGDVVIFHFICNDKIYCKLCIVYIL